jgi:hypothetical protein
MADRMVCATVSVPAKLCEHQQIVVMVSAADETYRRFVISSSISSGPIKEPSSFLASCM